MNIPKRYWMVAGTFLLAMLLYIDRILISVAKPDVVGSLTLTEKQMGWAMSAFSLGYALFQIPSGRWADRLGPRVVLTAIVSAWSVCTALTGLAFNFLSLFIIRFLFGVGEAGAYPSINRAVYSWIPVRERGTVNGINFSAGRLGAAFALPLLAGLIQWLGWRACFGVLGVSGIGWAVVWYTWFRDQPDHHATISTTERDYIQQHRQAERLGDDNDLQLPTLWRSGNMWLLMVQYFSNNFTFFFCLTWLFPHLKERFLLTAMEASLYASVPLLFGAVGNWLAGWLVDLLFRRGHLVISRRLPASLGFLLSAVGLVFSVYSSSVLEATCFLSMAVMGADMTLSPSWATCSDIGGRHSGVVSGTMNMFGNLGAFLTALAFPYLKDWTGTDEPFFFVGALLNMVALLCWQKIDPERTITEPNAQVKLSLT
jgi:MFS transporter, ACS family, glucarate transporter